MYTSTISHILVFKTNIHEDSELRKIEFLLNNVDAIDKWTIDRSDVDNVLRVESETLKSTQVCRLIHEAGFFCEELTD